MARIRISGTDPSTVPTPPAGKSTLFVDINDLSYKAKLPNGTIIPISTTPEFIQDTIGAFFQDSSTINFTYDDNGDIAYFEVIESGLDIFQIPFTPTGNLVSTNVGAAIVELDSDLNDHVTNPTGAHAASAISYNNLSSNILESINAQTALDEIEQIIYEEQIVIVSKNAGTGQFLKWKDAIDSIVDASAAKPYIIKGGPGVFVEDTLVLKPFVVLQGQDDGTTIIEVDDPSKTAIIGSNNSEVRNIGIRGSTDNNTDLIYFQGTSNAGGFSLIECALGNAYRLVHVEGDGFPTFFRMEGTRIFNDAVFTEGFLVDKASTGIVQGFFADLIYQKLTGPYPDIMFRSTNGSRIILNAVTIETNGNTTHGVYLDNGSQLDIITAALSGMDNAIYLPNVGSAPQIQIEQLTLRNNNEDLLIEHINAFGNFSGNADFTKISVDPSADVALFYSDNVAGGIASSGSLRLGRRHEVLFDGLDLLEGTPGMGIIFGGFLEDNGGFEVGVGSGFGYLASNDYPDHQVKRIDWNDTSITLAANQDVYIYYNSSGILTSSASIGNTDDIILIGRVVTNSSGIELIDQSPMLARNAINQLNRALRDGFGTVYESGSIVTENSTPFKIDVSGGRYFYSFNRFSPIGGMAIDFMQYYRDGVGGYNRSMLDTVNSTQYDDGSGTLQSLTSGYYTAHTLYINCDDADEKYFLVIGQEEYSALAAIESSPLPTAPSWLRDAVTPIARIVIEEGTGNIAAIYDIRPVVGFKSSGVSASADHGNLLGLNDDDHPQYLLVNGSRAMANDLDMGGNDITNINTIDGVDPSSHASQHNPNGTDALATANTAQITDSTTSVGIANSFLRSDAQIPHGNRGGGSLHALANGSAHGFLSSSDFSKLASIEPNAKDDQSAAEVPYSNATSGLIATNVQQAIDANDARLDAIESQTYVNSFNSRTGAVTSQNGDYIASQITNTPAGNISATNVQDAINELDTEKQPLDADLTALAALATTGIVVRSAANTFNTRAIQGSVGEINVTNGGGIAGDPLISLPNVGTAGSVGSVSQSLSITTDSKGRVTSRTAQAIAIAASQVTDFANAVRNTALTGFVAGTNTPIVDTDTVLQGFNKTQGQLNDRVVGPASSTDNAVARYDLTTGKIIQNSAVTIDDNGGLSAAAYLRPGTTADTTNGNIRYTNNELQGRVNGVWRVLGRNPTKISATGDTSTTSGTYGTIASMTTTPAAGTYMVIFECSASLGSDTNGDIAMFVGGVEQTDSTKTLDISADGGFGPTATYEVPVTIIDHITVNGAQAINIQFRENGGGTLTVGPRKLTVIPIAR